MGNESMQAKDRGWCIGRWVVVSVVAMVAAWTLSAQVSTTSVEGTVYLANGVPGSGTLQQRTN